MRISLDLSIIILLILLFISLFTNINDHISCVYEKIACIELETIKDLMIVVSHVRARFIMLTYKFK